MMEVQDYKWMEVDYKDGSGLQGWKWITVHQIS